jgi:hypothetical protein
VHFRRAHKGEAVTANRLGDCSQPTGHRRFLYPSPSYVVASPGIPPGADGLREFEALRRVSRSRFNFP